METKTECFILRVEEMFSNYNHDIHAVKNGKHYAVWKFRSLRGVPSVGTAT